MNSPARCPISDATYPIDHLVNAEARLLPTLLNLNVPLVSDSDDRRVEPQLLLLHPQKPNHCRYKLEPILIDYLLSPRSQRG